MNANTILAFKCGTGVGNIRNSLASLPAGGVAGALDTPYCARLYTNTPGTFVAAALTIPIQAAVIGSASPLGITTNGAILGPAYGRMFGTPKGENAPYFNTASFDGVPFRLRVSGNGANGSTNVTVNICLGASTVIGGNVIIASTGAPFAVGVANFAFSIVADILWDAVLQKVTGRQSSVISTATGPATQVQSDVTLQNLATATAANIAALTFTVFITMATNAASLAYLQEFALEAI